jgi:glycosyltransferase involved in cell wall biosynthesis
VNKIDVVIPTHNRDPQRTIISVMEQTYIDYHIYVCVDGTDNWMPYQMEEEYPEWKSDKISFLFHQDNRGASAARNTCINAGSGEIIAYLDDDDFWYPDHLETVMDYFNKYPNRELVCTKAWAIKEKNCDIIRAELWIEELEGGKWKGFLPAPYYNTNMINYTNVAPTLCIAHKRSCLDVGRFDEGLPVLNDWEMFQRMSLAHRMFHIDKFTGEYSIHGKGIISNNAKIAPLIEKVIRERSEIRLVTEILKDQYNIEFPLK